MGLWDVVVPVTSVVVTGGVAVWSKIIDARSKREDRQHARALDYEGRVWQAKNDALRRLISACRFVKWQEQLTGAEKKDENYRRAVIIRALDQFRERVGGEDGISEITAYAAQPVREALDQLLEEVNAQVRKHRLSLLALRDIGTQLDAVAKEPLTDDSGGMAPEGLELLHRRGDLTAQREKFLYQIGSKSDLDVDAVIAPVIALCDRIIDVARNDLQGR